MYYVEMCVNVYAFCYLNLLKVADSSTTPFLDNICTNGILFSNE